MKPLGKKNYGSIPHLLTSKLGAGDHHIHEGQHNILTIKKRDKHDTILVSQKYDGSNVGVAKKDGKIIALTRSGHTADTSPYYQHHLFNDYVDKYKSKFDSILNEGERICGEWLAQVHSLEYKVITDHELFMAFDLFTPENERVLFEELHSRCMDADIFEVDIVHKGEAMSIKDAYKKVMGSNGMTVFTQCIDKPEGMVYRIERKGKVDFLAKWVRPDFVSGKHIIDKEVHQLLWNNKTWRWQEKK